MYYYFIFLFRSDQFIGILRYVIKILTMLLYRNFVPTTAGGTRLIKELFQTYVNATLLNLKKKLCLLMFEIRCKITCIYTYLEKIMREQWLLYMHVHGHFNNVA